MTTKQELARELYFQHDLTQADIARILKVDPKTVYRWMKQDNWKRIKEAALHAPAVIKDKVYFLLNELANDVMCKEPGKRYPTMEESRNMNLMANVINKLDSKPSLSENIQMMMNFSHNLAKKDLKKAQAIMADLDEHINGEAKNTYKPYETEYCADEMKIVLEDMYPQEFEDGSVLQPETPPEQPKAEIQVTPQQKAKIKEIRKTVATLQPRPGITFMSKGRVIDYIKGGSRELTKQEWNTLLQKGYSQNELELALLNEFSWDKEPDIST